MRAASQNEGSHMIPNRTSQLAAQATEEYLGQSLQQRVSAHQSTPRAESMPYMMHRRPNSTLAKRLTHQIIDPPFRRAQSSSPLRHAGPHCQRAQSPPLTMRGGMLDARLPMRMVRHPSKILRFILRMTTIRMVRLRCKFTYFPSRTILFHLTTVGCRLIKMATQILYPILSRGLGLLARSPYPAPNQVLLGLAVSKT